MVGILVELSITCTVRVVERRQKEKVPPHKGRGGGVVEMLSEYVVLKFPFHI